MVFGVDIKMCAFFLANTIEPSLDISFDGCNITMVPEMLSSRNLFILKKSHMVLPRKYNLCLMLFHKQLKDGREVRGAASFHKSCI